MAHTMIHAMTYLNRNLVVLFLAQLAFGTGSVVLVTLGGIVGAELAVSKSLATLPMSLFVVGTALATVPAALLMQRIGRRFGFAASAMLGVAGALLASEAVIQGSFGLFCGASALIGMTLAFGQQFRFAATESVPEAGAAYAVAFVLLGSIGGAFAGASLVANASNLTSDVPFRGAFLGMAVLYVVAGFILLVFSNPPETTPGKLEAAARPLLQVVRQPLFVIAVSGGVIGQGVMTYLMTATPISMHVVDGHSLSETSGVIRAHVIAMFLPSLVTAPLIAMFGPRRLMCAGVVAMGVTVVCGLAGQQVMHYWWALVLLGVGWNFLFIGGTTLLVRNYHPAERFKAQAFNDFSVFGASALASLLAGTLMFQLGWQVVLYSALPLLLGMALLLAWSLRISPLHPRAATNA